MRLRIGIAAAGAALLAAGLSGAATPRQTVLGVSWEGTGRLARLDARTLRPVGRQLDIGKPPIGLAARSPDGRTIVLGHGSVPELRFVDVRTMRNVGLVRLDGLGPMLTATWPEPGRLVALRSGETAEVVVVDPQTRRVVDRRPLEGEPTTAVLARGRLLALLAPERAVGPARLAVVGADGSVRTIALPGIVAGFAPAETPGGVGRDVSPGVAGDPSGRRAAVVTPETLVTVDLETLEVTATRRLQRRPARAAKRLEGWGRGALWLPGDRIAITGWNATSDSAMPPVSAGATLYDLRSGSSRTLDPAAVGVERLGATLLVYGGAGLRGYRLDGSLRFMRLRGRDTGYVQAAGRWAYVGTENSTRFAVVDVVAGKVLGTVRTARPTIVMG